MTVKKAYPRNNGSGGSGEANTASTEGGISITLPKDGDNLPFKGPSAPSNSDISLTSTATTVEFDVSENVKTMYRSSAVQGFIVPPNIDVVPGSTIFGISNNVVYSQPGEVQFVNRAVFPQEVAIVSVPNNASIPIVHTGQNVVWLSYSYNFGTQTLTLHQDLMSPGVDLSDKKVLLGNLTYETPGLTTLNFSAPEPYLAHDNVENLRALIKAVGGIRISGLVGTPNIGATSLNVSAGVASRVGGNILVDPNNPWQVMIAQQNEPAIVQKYATSDSSTATFNASATLDLTQYSDGTSLQLIPGSDPWAIMKIAVSGRNTTVPDVNVTVMSFQPETLYKNESDAIAAAESATDKWTEGEDTLVFSPAFYIVFERTMTDLTAATFIPMPARRGGGGGGSGAATSGYNEIWSNGAPLTQRQIIDFINAASAIDNPSNESTEITFPTGGSVTSAFSAQLTSSQTIVVNGQEDIIFNSEVYDLSNEYDPVTGVFTATNTGIHIFSGGAGKSGGPSGGGRLRVSFKVDDGVSPVFLYEGIDRSSTATDIACMVSGDIFLTAGDKVSVDCRWYFALANIVLTQHPALIFTGRFVG